MSTMHKHDAAPLSVQQIMDAIVGCEASDDELREMIAAALADARREGAEQMRAQLSTLTPEMARAACWRYTAQSAGDYARAVSASPLPSAPA